MYFYFKKSPVCFCCCIIFLPIFVSSYVQAKERLPENFTKKISLQPAITKVIEDDKLKRAMQKLNTMHGDMAMEGWELFSVIEYIDDGDFEGFFVTYVKSKSVN